MISLNLKTKLIYTGIFLILILIILHTLIIKYTLANNKKINDINIVLISKISNAKVNVNSLISWQSALFQIQNKKIEYFARRKIDEILEAFVFFLEETKSTNYVFSYNTSIADLNKIFNYLRSDIERYGQNQVKSEIDGVADLEFRSSCQLIEQLLIKFENDVIYNIEKNNNQTYFRILSFLLLELVIFLSTIVLLLFNISKRKHTERQLNNIRKYLSNIINSMPSIIVGVNQDKKITQWNNTAEEYTGVNSESSLGNFLEQYFPQIPETIIADSLINKTINKITNEIIKNGSIEKIEEITIYPLITNGVQEVIIRIDDITEKVKTAESLKQTQKMEAIGQLACGIAHDFNNIITGINGSAELLLRKENITEKESRYLNSIINGATRAGELTHKLLTFGRKTKTEMSPLDIQSVIENSIGILKSTIDKKITLKTDFHAENTIINGDKAKLQSIIINLGINSSHAMPNGGTLSIATKVRIFDETDCKKIPFDIKPGEFIEVKVQDTGYGIPKEYLQKIFEPFYTTKGPEKGTGLGLSTTYGNIKEHKGAIIVYSEVGIGTIFRIYLPLLNNDQKPVNLSEHVLYGEGSILIVDDEEIVRETTAEILTDLGYMVYTAANGEDAINKYKNLKDSIDLVILDMIMPVMHGSEVYKELLHINPSVRAILSTGFSKEEDICDLKEYGLCGVINKPFSRIELSKMIYEILKEKSSINNDTSKS